MEFEALSRPSRFMPSRALEELKEEVVVVVVVVVEGDENWVSAPMSDDEYYSNYYSFIVGRKEKY